MLETDVARNRPILLEHVTRPQDRIDFVLHRAAQAAVQ
ncbi:hypothetical protein SBA4_40001 [Candidatus Sulfopaludibacter sp. SbA4]|nr:hypothetical protein SBA4_40001 [Candidatus Sulfopaludibacter sp. SbA4]